MNDMKKAIVALSAVGLLVLLMNMFGNRPASVVLYDPHLNDEHESQLSSNSSEGPAAVEVLSEKDAETKRKLDLVLWGEPGPVLEPCWADRLPQRVGKSWGFVVVTTSNGPHNHRAQIADAVVIASQLKATLILPTIKESSKEPSSGFKDIYNWRNFVSSLDGVVRVVENLPNGTDTSNMTTTSIPLGVTRDFINKTVRPIFSQQGGMVLLGTFLPTVKGEMQDKELTAIRCLVMYKSLQYVSVIQRLGDRLINRMREAALKSSGKRFLAIDLQVDLLKHKACNVTDKKRCFESQETGQFLRAVGYDSETAIYVTQSRWRANLQPLLKLFPNVQTKEYSMPFNEEAQFLFTGKTQIEQAVDFYVCSRSDVFIATIPGLFYAHVAGERILAGRNHIILPSLKEDVPPGSAEVQYTAVTSPYVQKKKHPVYRCSCKPSEDSTAASATDASPSPPKKGKKSDNLPTSEPEVKSTSEKESPTTRKRPKRGNKEQTAEN